MLLHPSSFIPPALSPMTIRILTSNSTLSVLEALVPGFERAGGGPCEIAYDSAIKMLARIKGGETGDVLVFHSGAFDELAPLKTIVAGSRRPFALSRVGVAVRSGAPRPDISSVEAFRSAMLPARSIAHTVHGASGMYIPVLMERLGIAAQMKPKTVTRPGGYIGGVVASGEAEIALQQIVELLAVPGIDLVGPLPDALQKVFETSAGIFSASKQPQAAEALLRYLLAPGAASVFREKGLEQAH